MIAASSRSRPCILSALLLTAGLQACAIHTRHEPVAAEAATTRSLVTRAGTSAECKELIGGECEVLDLGGRALLSNLRVSIDATFPAQANPKVVFATGWSGGAACCWTTHLIDLTRVEPIVLDDVPGIGDDTKKAKVQVSATGVTYESYEAGAGLLGEHKVAVNRYQFGAGKIEKIESTTIYSHNPMNEKQHPSELFNDPVRRAPLLKVTGPAEFKELRSRIQVSGPPQKASDSVYVWRGCRSHFCSSSEGIFVVDVDRNQAWAMYFEEDSGRYFGVLTQRDKLVVNVLASWIGEHGLRWDQFVRSTDSTNWAPVVASQ